MYIGGGGAGAGYIFYIQQGYDDERERELCHHNPAVSYPDMDRPSLLPPPPS